MNNSPTSPSVYHRSYHWFGFRQRALKISFIIIIIIVTLVWPAPSANVSGGWRYRFPVWCEPTQAVDGRLAFNDTTLRSGQYRPSLSALNFMRLQTKIAIESLDFGNKDTGLCCMQKGLANRIAKGQKGYFQTISQQDRHHYAMTSTIWYGQLHLCVVTHDCSQLYASVWLNVWWKCMKADD